MREFIYPQALMKTTKVLFFFPSARIGWLHGTGKMAIDETDVAHPGLTIKGERQTRQMEEMWIRSLQT